MIERLQHETRDQHADADAELDAMFRTDITSTHYLLFLMRTYGFDTPLEAAIAMTPNLDRLLDLRLRARAGFLAQDLLTSGLQPTEVACMPLCLAIPQFRSVSEALGWLYVSERSTLAHEMIRRHLMTRLPIEMERAAAYLRSYDGVVGMRWQELGLALDRVAEHPAIAERILLSAADAFRCRRAWAARDLEILRSAG